MKNAKAFVSELTLETLSSNKIISDGYLDSKSQIIHTESAKTCELIVIAPATANFIAKLANGICDDTLTNICAARNTELLVVPAMNLRMWENPANKRNIELLKKDNVYILDPTIGPQACGDSGKGRMEEPNKIADKIIDLINAKTHLYADKQILITAGPTVEKIDPVRAVTNFSSGKMGFALAKESCRGGANVKLISGPVHLPDPHGVDVTRVQTGVEMYSEVMNFCKKKKVDLFFGAAAVADWKANFSTKKIKKEQNSLSEIKWELNPDIVHSVGGLSRKQRPFTVGFAAETQSLTTMLIELEEKRKRKNVDVLIANKVPESFNDDHIEVFFVQGNKPVCRYKGAKTHIAKIILEKISLLSSKNGN